VGRYVDLIKKQSLSKASEDSQKWYNDQQKLLHKSGLTAETAISQQRKYNVTQSKFEPGEMYLFRYDPKYKDVLPVWDMYPLVFPYDFTDNGFIGLNLHFLSYKDRAELLDMLVKYKDSKTLNEHTKLKISWEILKRASTFKAAEQSIRRYLWTHVKTDFKKIDSRLWGLAVSLPLAKFTRNS